MLRRDDSAFSSGSPLTRLALLVICGVGAALALGCTPKIGDECTVSTNCSTAGDRLCDITQPGGYCTVFNCEPGSCPADSACVNFGTSLSVIPDVPECTPSQDNSPYQRSFCMATCGSDADCRGGYRCKAPEDLNAVRAEHDSSFKVCAVPPKDPPKDNSKQVCLGSDAGAEPSAGGASSTAGSGGGSGTEGGAAGDGGSGN